MKASNKPLTISNTLNWVQREKEERSSQPTVQMWLHTLTRLFRQHHRLLSAASQTVESVWQSVHLHKEERLYLAKTRSATPRRNFPPIQMNESSYLRPTASAGRAGRTQTARHTSFWLPGAFPSSPPALYTRRSRLKVRGRAGSWAAVTLGNCTHTSHQRIGAAAHPDQAEKAGWPSLRKGENGRLLSGSRLCGTHWILFQFGLRKKSISWTT